MGLTRLKGSAGLSVWEERIGGVFGLINVTDAVINVNLANTMVFSLRSALFHDRLLILEVFHSA